MRKPYIVGTLLMCLLALLVLTACGGQDPTPSQQYTLDELLTIAHERRLAIQPPDYQWILDEFRNREPAEPLQPYGGDAAVSPLYMTAHGAIDDIMLLFHVLRSAYGPYIYFGGDDMFLPLRDRLIDEIIDSINRYDEIRTTDFHRIVLAGLRSVINDNHFIFGGSTVGQSATFFTSDTPFDRDEYGFWHRESGLRVAEIEGHNMYDVFRVSMDEQANVFYSAVIYVMEHVGLPRRTIYLVMEDNSRYELMLQRLTTDRKRHTLPSLEWVDGVAVVTIRNMGGLTPWPIRSSEQNQQMISETRTFISFATELQNESVIIIDVRGNSGGMEYVSSHFLHLLTRRIIPQNFAEVWTPSGEFTGVMHHPRQTPLIEHNQRIIILIDRHVSSGAEWFADRLFSMSNTLVVGQNTSGALMARTTFAPLTLSNSSFDASFGESIFIFPDGHFIEGVGFTPDIWVYGDALTATLALFNVNDND